MKISHLHLEHFRNYERLDFSFPEEPILVLTGENAQGKTNFLEALYILALTKSFRVSDRDFLRQFDESYYRIEAKGQSDEGDPLHLEICDIHEPAHQRVMKKSGVKISAPKFIGNLKVILFRPEDLLMLTGERSIRRQYMNNILIQTSQGYMRQLQLYHKLLTQRNALLLQVKLNATPVFALDLWDEQLAEAGSALLTSRFELVKFLQEQLAEAGSAYEIAYDGTVKSASIDDFLQALKDARPRDTRSGHTSVGPHRDDLKLKIRNHPVELTASRGELRSCMMALKEAEIAWIKHMTGDMPIILLDDMFSELDTNRKNDLFDLLIPSDPSQPTPQIIMTIAEGNPLPSHLTATSKLKSASAVRTVHGGKILPTD